MPRSIARQPVAATLACLMLLGGCATRDYVDSKVGALERRQDARMDEIDATAREALERARAARMMAEGKFVYSVVLSDESMTFPSGGALLSTHAEKRLAELAHRLVSEDRDVFVEIQGHTDNVGSRATNLRLGQARADAAMLYLRNQGITANRMTTLSYGASQPVASNATAQGRARNRRIVLLVLK